MCGRFTILYTWEEIWRLSVPFWQALPEPTARYNVAPKSTIPIVRHHERGGEVATARWSLVPRWSATLDLPYSTFNARSEDAAGKPAFRESFRDRRCVISASGFYEWRRSADGTKRPLYITRADGEPLMFAGLWDAWSAKGSDPAIDGTIETATLLTTSPNAEMRPVHDRMPCVLEPEQTERWIDPKLGREDAQAMLRPAADGLLTMHAVGRGVGSVRNDGPRLIEPASDDDPGPNPKRDEPPTLFG